MLLAVGFSWMPFIRLRNPPSFLSFSHIEMVLDSLKFFNLYVTPLFVWYRPTASINYIGWFSSIQPFTFLAWIVLAHCMLLGCAASVLKMVLFISARLRYWSLVFLWYLSLASVFVLEIMMLQRGSWELLLPAFVKSENYIKSGWRVSWNSVSCRELCTRLCSEEGRGWASPVFSSLFLSQASLLNLELIGLSGLGSHWASGSPVFICLSPVVTDVRRHTWLLGPDVSTQGHFGLSHLPSPYYNVLLLNPVLKSEMLYR